MWPLATREIFVPGPEDKIVCKTLLILVRNFIKYKPIEDITFGILEEQQKEGKAFEMEMGWKSVSPGVLPEGGRPQTAWPRGLGILKPHQRFSWL